MSSYFFKDRNGSTPIDPDQLEGIKFPHVTMMSELDELEDRNIQDGMDWLNRQKKVDYLNTDFLDKLHKKLFSNVWKWAGTHRQSMVNLSKVDRFNIKIELSKLFEDVKTRIEFGHTDWGEISAEFHHRLVSIHPYPNGNGRVSRIMTEYLQKRNNKEITNWSESLMSDPKKRRDLYISSLVEADKGNYVDLIKFMKEKRIK